ncbi:MAG: hypothetical protein HUU29_02135 [Planctomycetaceae bacterium]|nr:hypothetical protein [Planctomycetaceae bacterium]
MKSNPLLLAITFLLGCLVTLMAVDRMQMSVQAQDASGAAATASGNGGVDNLTVIPFYIDQNRQGLAVFRTVKNIMEKDATGNGPEVLKDVTGVVIYDFVVSNKGKGDLVNVTSRYIDYDFHFDYTNKDGKANPVEKMREAYVKSWKAK